jgi:hypothetical protein
MYRTVCVELDLSCLAVNTLLEARHVHGLDGVDLSRELVQAPPSIA